MSEFSKSLLAAMKRFRAGDFSCQLQIESSDPVEAETAMVFNEISSYAFQLESDIERLRLEGADEDGPSRLRLNHNSGPFARLSESFNSVIDGVLVPTHEVVRILDAVANGDLSQNVRSPNFHSAQHARVSRSVERMTDVLGRFSKELTRVIRD